MKMLMIALSMIFLASCKEMPIAPIYQFKATSNNCAVRCFDYGKMKMVVDEECGKDFHTDMHLPAKFCDGIIGPSIELYAKDLKPALIENMEYCADKD